MISSFDYLDPVTITPDRYTGAYAGGVWLAFPLDPHQVPGEPFGDDTAAAGWWGEHGDLPIGRGDTPDLAYADLVRRLEAIRPARVHPAHNEFTGTSWTWHLPWPGGKPLMVSRSWRGAGTGPPPWPDD